MTNNVSAEFMPALEPLLARPNDPWLGVHELSQYTFCHRAGLNTTHMDVDDRGQDDNHVPPLDFQPEYEAGAIDRFINLYSFRVLAWAVALLILTWITVTWSRAHILPLLLSGAFATICLFKAVTDAAQLIYWCQQRWQTSAGENWLPDPDNPDPERLNWWQLSRAGFESVSTAGGLRDEELRLAGEPFKLLQRGDEYIPVFLRRGEGTKIYPQHFVRMAAYCLLLQRQTSGKARYGVILQAGTFDCVAIKFNRESFDLMSLNMTEARRVVHTWDQLEQAPQSPPPHVCRKCPFAFPLSVESQGSLKLREQTGLPARANIGSDGKRYHCHCGDRFGWMPPHAMVIEKGIPH